VIELVGLIIICVGIAVVGKLLEDIF
jgi:hypothetical protein